MSTVETRVKDLVMTVGSVQTVPVQLTPTTAKGRVPLLVQAAQAAPTRSISSAPSLASVFIQT